MTANDAPGTSDAELVRYLDGELDAEARGRIDQRLAGDPELARRLERLRRRGGNLSRLLDRTDVPFEGPDVRRIESARSVRARPWQRPSLRAAAAILLLLGVIAAVPPLRAWVASQVERLTGSGDATQTAPPAAEPIDTLGVRYQSPFPTLDIEFLNRQAGGRLIVRVQDTDSISVEFRKPAGSTEAYSILAATVRIVNTPESTAEYEVIVPASIRRVGIRMPGSIEYYPTLDTANHVRIFEFPRR